MNTCANKKNLNGYKHDEFTEKILKGLEISYQRMIEFKKQKNSVIVVSQNGKIVKIQP